MTLRMPPRAAGARALHPARRAALPRALAAVPRPASAARRPRGRSRKRCAAASSRGGTSRVRAWVEQERERDEQADRGGERCEHGEPATTPATQRMAPDAAKRTVNETTTTTTSVEHDERPHDGVAAPFLTRLGLRHGAECDESAFARRAVPSLRAKPKPRPRNRGSGYGAATGLAPVQGSPRRSARHRQPRSSGRPRCSHSLHEPG